MIYSCCDGRSFDAIIVNQEHKDKIINTNGTQEFKKFRPTMPTLTDEKELFHYTIDNITEDKSRILQRI